MLFSLIVPVFNASRHLRECLDSILGQSIADWECICVDDGSTDESASILREYSNKDSRFCVVDLGQNKGVSFARNAGLDCAKGECIGFIDSDDIISPHWLEAARDAFSTNADMVKMSISREYSFPNYCRPSHVRELMGYDVFDFSVLRGGLTVQNFYKREMLDGVRFCDGMKVYEDAIFNLDALLNVKKAVRCDFAGYWYRDSDTSAWRRRSSDDIVRLISELVRWYNQARVALHECDAELLAKDRLSGYVMAIVQDFMGNANFSCAKNAACKLPSALQSFEGAIDSSLADKIAFGLLSSIKRYAYLRFVRHGNWCLLWLLFSTIHKLKEVQK